MSTTASIWLITHPDGSPYLGNGARQISAYRTAGIAKSALSNLRNYNKRDTTLTTLTITEYRKATSA